MQFLFYPLVNSSLSMLSRLALSISALQVWHDVWINVFKRRVYTTIINLKQHQTTTNNKLHY